MIYPWVQSAKIYDGTNRQVIVTHAEGTNLHLTLQGKFYVSMLLIRLFQWPATRTDIN